MDELERRIEELESQAAFQDELHQQLNDIVARQDRELRELKSRIDALAHRIRELGESAAGGHPDPADEIPPHY